MTEELRIKNLSVPTGPVDVVLDTDTYNEIDDQYALAYLVRSEEKLNTKAIYAAPFSSDYDKIIPADGMEKSYQEIFRIMKLVGAEKEVYRGSCEYLKDEKTPVISDAAKDLAERVKSYSPEKPLYVVAIGAITNIASAILLNPEVAENTVVVWLGGHARHYHHTSEYNMMQDVAAARVVFKSGVPLVQLPCMGVVNQFSISKPELDAYLVGKNELSDYLSTITIAHVEQNAKVKCWSKPLWDVTAVAWLLNDNDRFMMSRLITAPIPSYDNLYTENPGGHLMRYVYFISRDRLMDDLIEKITC